MLSIIKVIHEEKSPPPFASRGPASALDVPILNRYTPAIMSFMKAHKDGVALSVRVAPGASRESVSLDQDAALTVRLAAAPVEGKANKELVRLLAKLFKTAPSNVRILHGEKSRSKVVLIRGMSVESAEKVMVGLRGQGNAP